MSNSTIDNENELMLLRSEITKKEQIINKLNAKIENLQNIVFTNQKLARDLNLTMADKNQHSKVLQNQNQILQTDCDHLQSQIQTNQDSQDSAGSELQKRLKDLENAKNEHNLLREQIRDMQFEVRSSNETETNLLQKVKDLSNQKKKLELENTKLKPYQSLLEEAHSQLKMAKLQIQQLESIHNQTQESIGLRENELIKLRGENEILQNKLIKVKSANKQFEKQVSQLSSKMQAASIATDQLNEIQNRILIKDQEILEMKTKNQILTEKIKKLKSKKSDKSVKSQIHKLENKLKLKEQELIQHQQLLKSFQNQFQMNPQGFYNANPTSYMNFPLCNDNFNQNPSIPEPNNLMNPNFNFNSNINNNSNNPNLSYNPNNMNNFNNQNPNNLMNPNFNFNSNMNNNNPNLYANPNNIHNFSNITLTDYMNLKEQYQKLKEKYSKLKQEHKATLEEVCSLKLYGTRLDDDISTYQKAIASLKQERDELKSKLTSSESFLEQCSKRMANAERETALIREHMMSINANQDELADLKLENNQLRKRMDELEQDLIVYTERKRKTLVRPTRPRKTAMVQ